MPCIAISVQSPIYNLCVHAPILQGAVFGGDADVLDATGAACALVKRKSADWCGSAGAGAGYGDEGRERGKRGVWRRWWRSGGKERRARCRWKEGGADPAARLGTRSGIDGPPHQGEECGGEDDECGRADERGEDEGAEVGQDHRREGEHGKVEGLHARRAVRERVRPVLTLTPLRRRRSQICSRQERATHLT
ncbi:hypothetical protein JB92DRAFT_2833164 [Gautieria morchelliformis]|nr:hypothetical protein JB92DRAFT_2833164 [Gautieria morchelliformis]